MEKKNVKTTIDELEIEPLSDEALRMITGGEACILHSCPSTSCTTLSCSAFDCSGTPDPRGILDGVTG